MPHFCPHPLQKRVNVRRYVLLPGVLNTSQSLGKILGEINHPAAAFSFSGRFSLLLFPPCPPAGSAPPHPGLQWLTVQRGQLSSIAGNCPSR